mgnify:CR=1 FL=1
MKIKGKIIEQLYSRYLAKQCINRYILVCYNDNFDVEEVLYKHDKEDLDFFIENVLSFTKFKKIKVLEVKNIFMNY